MKRKIAWIMVVVCCAALLPVCALAENWYCNSCGHYNDLYFCAYCGSAKPAMTSDCWSLAIDKLSTRNGPSPRYTDMGTYNLKGQYVRIAAKAWDSVNGIWWVKADVPGAGLLWTGAKRFDASTLQLDMLAEESWPYNPTGGVTSSGGGSSITQQQNGGSNTGSPYAWLIGKWGRVCVNEGHARSGPGTNYSKVDVVFYDEWCEILDVQRGDTTKDWCKVRATTGEIYWISTGLLEIDGYQGGTIYGNWAP